MSDADADKADAIGRAEAHADEAWKTAALSVIETLAEYAAPFTADDVWSVLNVLPVATHEPAALGPVFLTASRRKVIRKTGRLVPSVNPIRHRNLTEWIGSW